MTIVERLLSCSVPVDINANEGRTPLWSAALNGHVHCVDVLLKMERVPNMRGDAFNILQSIISLT